MIINDEPNASFAPNLHEGGPSLATGENVYTLSMFFCSKRSWRFKNVSYVVCSPTYR